VVGIIAKIVILIGWVEEQNPTLLLGCWVLLSLNPTYFKLRSCTIFNNYFFTSAFILLTFMALSVVSGLALWQWRLAACKSAAEVGIPVNEVDWLLMEVAGIDSLSLRLESFKERSQIALLYPLSVLSQLWQERLNNRVPIQYLAGVTPWRNFDLKVSPAVLIPRPETEYIIDIAVAAVKESPTSELELGEWADLGTGSGAIALGLAEAFNRAIIHAVDYSSDALTIAQLNAKNLNQFN
jgi:release factor glutamine methyltransferase